MAELTSNGRFFKILAGLLGTLQGLAWMVMSAICIGFHSSTTLTKPDGFDKHQEPVQFDIYAVFLKDEFEMTFDGQILLPTAFIVVSGIYLAMDFIWVISSVIILFRQSKVRNVLILWCIVTSFVCIWDVIVTIILGADYQNCINNKSDEFCQNVVLTVLFIAAKGFLLWIVNVSLIIILAKLAKHSEEPPSDKILSAPSFFNPKTKEPSFVLSPQPQLSPKPGSPVYETPFSAERVSQMGGVPVLPPSPIRRSVSGYNTPSVAGSLAPRRQTIEYSSPGGARRWEVYSPMPRSNPPNWSRPPPLYRAESAKVILSNVSQKPFVLATPPRRQ